MNSFNKNNILKYCYFGVMFFLPISIFLDNLILIIFTILTFFIGKRVYLLSKLYLSSLLLFFIYILLLGLVNSKIEVNEYIKLLPLLIIPYVLTFLRIEVITKGLYFLLIAIIIKQLISVYGVIDYYYFTEGKKTALRSYAGINDVLRMERPYLGFLSALNVIIAYYLFKEKRIWIFVLVCFFSTLIVVLISARLGLLIIIGSLFAILLAKISKILKYVVFIFSFVTLIIFTLTNNPLKNRFQQIKYDTRIIVWDVGLQIAKENSDYIFGLKSQNEIKNRLTYYYENKVDFEYLPDKIRFTNKKYNTHNQYLNELLRGGLPAFFLLLLPFVLSLFNTIKHHNLTYSLLLLAVLLFFLVENLLARQIGVYIIAIILSLTRNTYYEES